MSDAFEADVMEDLMSDAAEGPARTSFEAADDFEDAAFDELDEGDDDEFLSGIIGGGSGPTVGGPLGVEDDYDDAFYEGDGFDDDGAPARGTEALEDALADALEAADTDEFLGRLGRIARRAARGAGRLARGATRGLGSLARVVGPIASMIPLPQAQLIGRIANIAGRLMADGADEFEAFEEMMDLADSEDAIDAAAPFMSAITLRTAMPGVSRLPRQTRRQLVRGVSRATRTLARRQGPQAARAVQPIVRSVRRAVRQRRIPARAAAQAVQRTAARVARSPQATRRLVARAAAAPARRAGTPCPTCGRARHIVLRAPATLTIRTR